MNTVTKKYTSVHQKPLCDCFDCRQVAAVAHSLYSKHRLVSKHSLTTLRAVVKLHTVKVPHKPEIENAHFQSNSFAIPAATTKVFQKVQLHCTVSSFTQTWRIVLVSVCQRRLSIQTKGNHANLLVTKAITRICFWQHALCD